MEGWYEMEWNHEMEMEMDGDGITDGMGWDGMGMGWDGDGGRQRRAPTPAEPVQHNQQPTTNCRTFLSSCDAMRFEMNGQSVCDSGT